jgi:tripartite-type tricarboxylate transporter receptor subunit TctC
MKLQRRQFLRLAAAVAAFPLLSWTVRAEIYPARPIRLIIGFPPGSAADTIARIIGKWLSERLGQPVITESKPGAATNISIQATISSPPDGYTLVFISTANAINATLFGSLPFDYLRDIAPVAGVSRLPMVLVVNPTVPANTVAELIAYAKANPGKMVMASFGTGTASHLAGELFKSMTGTNMIHVPYRGSPPAHIDLLSGRAQVMFDTMTASLPYIRTGAFHALAVLGNTRLDQLPNVPTLSETVSGYEVDTWNGLGAPLGTPPGIIEKLYREISAGLADPTIKARLVEVAAIPMPLAPADFAWLMAAETEKWAKVVKFSGAKAE